MCTNDRQLSDHDQNILIQKRSKTKSDDKRGRRRNKFKYSPSPIENIQESSDSIEYQIIRKLSYNWIAKTQLGKLVLEGKIRSIEEIFLRNMKITEEEIVDHIFGNSVLKEEVFRIKPVEIHENDRSTKKAFKVVVIVGDYNGHIGIGVKTSCEIADAIKDAKKIAKLSIIPVARSSWQSSDRCLHTIGASVIGNYENIEMKLMPAPKGMGIIACSVAKKLLEMAGFKDVFTSSIGHAKSTYHYLIATYKALQATFFNPAYYRNTHQKRNSMHHLTTIANTQNQLANQSAVSSQINLGLTPEIII